MFFIGNSTLSSEGLVGRVPEARTLVPALSRDRSMLRRLERSPLSERVKETGFQCAFLLAAGYGANVRPVSSHDPVPRIMAQRLTSSPVRRPIPGAAGQAALVRNRCAAIRLLASACHNATAWALIKPRTGMKPNP